jgi:predicted ArsR family transcriptional regulator
MAREKGVRRKAKTVCNCNVPPILRAMRESIAPLLDVRPAGAMTARELAEQSNASVDVVRRQLTALRAEGVLREARVRCERGRHTVVYWIEG